MQSLFQMDDDPDAVRPLADSRAEEENLVEPDLQYLEKIIASVSENKLLIDKYITDYTIDWDIGRLGKVERAVLRLAIAEMLYIDDVPSSVAINEAVLLAKKYGADQASKFINGILGKFSRDALGEKRNGEKK
jgi:transcription antitermination protein NusB